MEDNFNCSLHGIQTMSKTNKLKRPLNDTYDHQIIEPPKKRFKKDWLTSPKQASPTPPKAISPLSKPHTIFEDGHATPIYNHKR